MFWRYKVVENWKCTQWPQKDLNHLTVKRNMYTLNTQPQGPNFNPFRSMTSRFRDKRSKIGNAPNDNRRTLTTLLSNVTCIHWILIPKAQISIRFALRPSTARYKVVKNRKCAEWPQNYLNHLTVKRTRYTPNTHPEALISFCSALWQAVFEIQYYRNRKFTEWLKK